MADYFRSQGVCSSKKSIRKWLARATWIDGPTKPRNNAVCLVWCIKQSAIQFAAANAFTSSLRPANGYIHRV